MQFKIGPHDVKKCPLTAILFGRRTMKRSANDIDIVQDENHKLRGSERVKTRIFPQAQEALTGLGQVLMVARIQGGYEIQVNKCCSY